MKKIIISLFTLALMVASSHAGLVFTDSFSYSDGSLNTNGTWFTHSATSVQTGQVQVASQKVTLSQSLAEDVSAPLSGAPITTGTLYMSAKVNFSALPVAASGNYFLHFRDSGTVNFKARVYAIATGAAPGMFRLGIGNAASNTGTVGETNIPTDLSLNTDYTIVVRYNAGTAAGTTLWINPSGEGSSTDRGDASDTATATPINFVCLRESNSGGGMGILTIDDLKVGTSFSDVVSTSPTLNPPSMSPLADVSIPANSNTGPLAFTVSDGETVASSLVLSKASSNTTLVPAANIVFGGSDTNRTVTVTPAAGQEGTATITVTATDTDNNSISRTFILTVGAPVISTFTEQVTTIGTPTAAIPFTIGDAETAASSLVLSKASSNTTLVATSGIVFGGSGSNRTVTITPQPGQSGVTLITIGVTDGFNTVSNSFVLTVSPVFGLVLADDFTYPDAPIYLNTGSPWGSHSGTGGQALVTNNTLVISGTNSEDVNSPLTNAPFPPSAGVIFYSKFTVNFSALPTGNGGEYFAHYKDGGSNFRAKIFSITNGAAAGKFRLGIANTINSPLPANDVIPTDLDLNTTYTVVTRFNNGSGTSKIWLNPTSESSFGIVPTDAPGTLTNGFYAFRENTGIGTITIDNLKIGTSFSDVVDAVAAPNPEPIKFAVSGANVTLTWTNATFSLQAAPTVTGTYTNVPGATSPYTTTTSGSQKYFRLKF